MSLNLAQKPFVNRRPVRRVGLILGALGFILAVVNGYLFWNHLSGQGLAETGLQGVVDQLQQETALLLAAEGKLEGFEPDELNRKVEFVNLRIRQRTFSWSRLFDRLAETLPADVRLTRLNPSFADASRGESDSRTRDLGSEEVILEIKGESRSSDALLEFVDRLFEHEAFADPDLHQEAAQVDRAVITFSISTLYRPQNRQQTAATPASTEEAE